jgi:xylulokinase
MDMEDQDLAQPALLGLDLGTSGAKAVLLGVDGRPLAEAGVGYPVDSPRPGWAETDPAAWWRAVSTAVRAACDQAAGVQVAAVGLDGQMHGLVLTDAAGQPLRPALLWADARAGEETAAWRRLPAPRRAVLANPIVPGMTGPLLRWVARHEPQAYRRAGWALLAKDWVRHRLTGEVATDPSDASATLLWDLPADRWADDVAAAVGLEPELLPPVAASGDQAGSLRADAAEALGLREGIPVAVGAADTAATLLATGLTDPAQVQLTVGTGGQIVRPVVPRPSPASAPRTHLYRAAAPDRWYAMAAVQNAGLALDWVRRTLRASWSELYGAARAGPPGALGVTFVPYLSGERTPVLRSDARGAWTGLGMAADRTALLQAAVEGVAFSLRHALEALPGPRPDHLRLAGGGTLDPRFRALLADVLQAELRPTDVRSASAVGAALLAAEAARLPRPAIPLSTSIPITPSGRSAAYNEPFDRYVQLAQQLSTVATPPRSGRPDKPDPERFAAD